eukprot:TRINITY_DN6160_c0_g1_i3.p1 TRINITY_DN6160_c0_g1~~TRINITY_DN6160_c0_g1_i3.p1  ORF type:complete len:395 (+),score=42.04 TRINITY_DN6160_c0_g1_i3:2-1186(+)
MAAIVKEIIVDGYRSLYTTQPIEEGDVLLREKPIVSAQFSWNRAYRYQACQYCLMSIESPQDMARRMCGDPTMVLPAPPGVAPAKSRAENPQLIADKTYCCVNCANADDYFRKVLASTPQDNIDTIEQVWQAMHPPPETTSLELLLRTLVKLVYGTVSEKAALRKLCCQYTWSDAEGHVHQHKLVQPQFESQLETLVTMVRAWLTDDTPDHPDKQDIIGEWLSDNGWRKLWAMVATNGAGIGICAIAEYDSALNELEVDDEGRQELDEFMDGLYERLDEEVGPFLNVEGSGLYALHSACNHSCQPNAEVRFNGTHELQLVALEPLEADQVCHGTLHFKRLLVSCWVTVGGAYQLLGARSAQGILQRTPGGVARQLSVCVHVSQVRAAKGQSRRA